MDVFDNDRKLVCFGVGTKPPFENSLDLPEVTPFEQYEPPTWGDGKYEASLSIPKSDFKLDLWKKPQTNPRNLVKPSKKRKFRVRKKWFNRYEKEAWLSRCIGFDSIKGGLQIKPRQITDAKLSKQGVKIKTD